MRFLVAFLLVVAWSAWLLASAWYMDAHDNVPTIEATLALINSLGTAGVFVLAFGIVTRQVTL